MTFAQTYREERLISRRSRARKARIAGRIIGFGLSACFLVALRTEPQLRAMVEDLALAVIGGSDERSRGATAGQSNPQAEAINALGYAPGSEEALALEELGITDAPAAPPAAQGQLPQSRVKVNRGISG